MGEVMDYQMFIDGKWTPGSSGEVMEVINPANREVVARVPLGNKEDVDRALAAARRTFESGVWANKSIEERASVLMNAAMLTILNKERLANLESLTSGATIRRTMTVDVAEVGASLAVDCHDGKRTSQGGTRLFCSALDRADAQLLEARAGRGVRRDHPLELSSDPGDFQDSAGAGHGEQPGHETGQHHPGDDARTGQDALRCRLAARGIQRGDRPRYYSGRLHGPASRSGQDRFYRVHHGGQADRPHGCGQYQACDAGTGGQVSHYRPR